MFRIKKTTWIGCAYEEELWRIKVSIKDEIIFKSSEAEVKSQKVKKPSAEVGVKSARLAASRIVNI